jgi:hypothetical protein
MRNERATTAARNRSDLSDYIVHLCRDDRESFPGGSPARKNFISIAKVKEIRAYKPHCLFVNEIKKLPEEFRKAVHERLSVSCYTEAPLEQIRHLVGSIQGRQYRFEPYGFVFLKDFILHAGGQPAFNINAYGAEKTVRAAAWALFEHCTDGGQLNRRLYPLLPFINQTSPEYDFAWEREWRINGTLEFSPGDVFCAIAPAKEKELREAIHKKGIPCIDPWDSEAAINVELDQFERAR